MTDAYIGEIRVFPYTFTPRGWAPCDGGTMTINGNTALFSVLGTSFGGDGRVTFGLPKLTNMVPMFWGQGPGLSSYTIGQTAGTPTVMLTTGEMPSHSHDFNASSDLATERQPAGQVFAQGDGISAFSPVVSPIFLDPRVLSASGNSAPHNNMMPYLTFHFCIAIEGEFPYHPQAFEGAEEES
jgi:microcystin-dependent protein